MLVALVDSARTEAWAVALRNALPAATVIPIDDAQPDDVEFVVGWTLDPDVISSLPNLRGVLVAGAGYDHLALARLPDVPIVRLADPAMAEDIASYCLAWIIRYQRDLDVCAVAQRDAAWIDLGRARYPRDVTVGVLGTGMIGSVVRDRCRGLGYPVIGWSRTQHDRSLVEFFGSCDVVVDVLPSTPETRHLVSHAELRALDDGVLINVGRGATVDPRALLAALEGPLRAAVLDVFETEPLPADSALWRHHKVVVTPHVAGRTDPVTAAPVMVDSMRRILAGEHPVALVGR